VDVDIAEFGLSLLGSTAFDLAHDFPERYLFEEFNAEQSFLGEFNVQHYPNILVPYCQVPVHV
jgi:hypothetical protein